MRGCLKMGDGAEWCSNCGRTDDGCYKLADGDWYCMHFSDNRARHNQDKKKSFDRAFATGWDFIKGGAICPVCGLDDATRMITGCPMKKK